MVFLRTFYLQDLLMEAPGAGDRERERRSPHRLERTAVAVRWANAEIGAPLGGCSGRPGGPTYLQPRAQPRDWGLDIPQRFVA